MSLVAPLVGRVSADPARCKQLILDIYRDAWLAGPSYHHDAPGAVATLIETAFDHLLDTSPTQPMTPAPPAAVTCVETADVARALDFYLDRGFDVDNAADGWVLLRHGAATVTVIAVRDDNSGS